MNEEKGILVIHVNANAQHTYGHPYQALLQQSAKNIVTFDIDSHSEPYMIQLAEKFLQGVENKLVIFHVAPEGGKFESFIRLFTNLARNPSGRLKLFCYPSRPEILSRFEQLIEMTVFSEQEKMESEVEGWINPSR